MAIAGTDRFDVADAVVFDTFDVADAVAVDTFDVAAAVVVDTFDVAAAAVVDTFDVDVVEVDTFDVDVVEVDATVDVDILPFVETEQNEISSKQQTLTRVQAQAQVHTEKRASNTRTHLILLCSYKW